MTWTSLTFNVGQILTAAQMTNLQANFSALANGDVGAPDIIEDAFTAITNGDSYRYSVNTEERSSNSGSYVASGLRIIVPRTGIWQVQFDLKNAGPYSYTSYGRIYRNPSTAYGGAVAFGTEKSTTSQTYVTQTDSSLSCNAGDVLELYIKTASQATYVTNLLLTSAAKLMG